MVMFLKTSILLLYVQDHKLKHMAELQLSVVSEAESRRQIGAQISAWEENLERLHCEQFRLRCYMASLQHGELPNPKVKVTSPALGYKATLDLNMLALVVLGPASFFIEKASPAPKQSCPSGWH